MPSLETGELLVAAAEAGLLTRNQGDRRFLPLEFATKAAAVAGVPAGRRGFVFVLEDESKAGGGLNVYAWDGDHFHHIPAIKEL
jgi:hypothetical protein